MHRSEYQNGGSSVLRYTVGILNDLVADKTADVLFVCRRGFLDEFAILFVDVVADSNGDASSFDVSHLLLQLLDIMHHVLKKIEQSIKRVLSSANSNRGGSGQSQRTPHSGSDLSKEDVEELLSLIHI